MEPTELKDPPAGQATVTDTAAVAPSLVNRTGSSVSLQADMPCPTCGNGAVSPDDTAGAASPSYIYALGRIEPRFPSPAVEKEFAQATARADTKGKTDRGAFQTVLSQPQNRYLVRQLCWVFTVQGLETYIIQPRDPADFGLLVEALGPGDPVPWISCLIGVRGALAPPEMCNGLMVPIVAFDQIYSFDSDTLIKAIPRPQKFSPKEFGQAAQELFWRIMQMTDNAGATDDHRALNYLSVRYPVIYATAAEEVARDCSLTGVEVRPSPLRGTRNIVETVFSFTNRNTDVIEKFFARVDVTEGFPFLVSKMSPYYDR